MASSIPAARAALHAGLSALTDPSEPLEGVGIYRTGRWTEDRAHDRITILNAANITREPAALATPTPIREEYTQRVAVEVYRQGNDLQVVEERLWELISAVEAYVMGNKTLSGTVNQALPGGVVDELTGPSQDNEDTLIAMATLQIDCWARVLLN